MRTDALPIFREDTFNIVFILMCTVMETVDEILLEGLRRVQLSIWAFPKAISENKMSSLFPINSFGFRWLLLESLDPLKAPDGAGS